MSARAAPVVVAGDRTHYLHNDECGVERHHIELHCSTRISLLRWLDSERARCVAIVNIEHGPMSAYLQATPEQLRVMAYAMLQCASEIDPDAPQQVAA